MKSHSHNGADRILRSGGRRDEEVPKYGTAAEGREFGGRSQCKLAGEITDRTSDTGRSTSRPSATGARRPAMARSATKCYSAAAAAGCFSFLAFLPAGADSLLVGADSPSNVGRWLRSTTRSRTPTNSKIARVPASPSRGLANRRMRV